MYKDILRSIVGIEIFPMISLCLFVLVFAVVLVWTSRLDGAWLARSASLPLEPDKGSAANQESHLRGGRP
jgi:hypothetical protein